ncbi:MAG: hypothetical protein M1827_001284 [Pycnora praestabilis]|nr:MAG: hypothetical protein M1827_001284 [Pycnora praestabilis]
MFLIQGEYKAVLYTGDVRAEAWWVNSLIRNPIMIPYSLGDFNLAKIYLDTTFALMREEYPTFPTKAQGLKELLQKVKQYPENTIFHFNAWTFGYEEVWVALAASLRSQLHVDRYKLEMYRSLSIVSGNGVGALEGPALSGYKCGNRQQPGCLTRNEDTRLHSCERGTTCSGLKKGRVVSITPIISRSTAGAELRELGAGGGGGDLNQIHELELNDAVAVGMLMSLCSAKIQDANAFAKVCSMISKAMASDRQILSLDTLALESNHDNIPLVELADVLNRVAKNREDIQKPRMLPEDTRRRQSQDVVSPIQPRSITFPYSRHSSYDELCHLIEALHPEDVYPCTTDEENWHDSVSMKSLFGHLCSGSNFAHDQEMIALRDERSAAQSRKRSRGHSDADQHLTTSSQRTESSEASNESQPSCARDVGPDGIVKSKALSKGNLNLVEAADRPLEALPMTQTGVDDHHVLSSPSHNNQERRVKGISATFDALPQVDGRRTSESTCGISTATPPSNSKTHSVRPEYCTGSRSLGSVHPGRRGDTRDTNPGLRTSSVTALTHDLITIDASTATVRRKAVPRLDSPVSIQGSSPTGEGFSSSSHPPPTEHSAINSSSSRQNIPEVINREGGEQPLIEPQSSPLESLLGSQSTTFADEHPDERLADRVEAYIAALRAQEGEWRTYSPLSGGNNHTEKEMDL